MRRNKAVIVISAALLLLIAGGSAFAQSATQWNNTGIERLNQKDYAGAVSAFRSAYQLKADDPTIRGNLAAALNAQGVETGSKGDYAQSMQLLEEALKLDPKDAVIRRNISIGHANRAIELMQKGEHLEAERIFEKAYDTSQTGDSERIDQGRADNFYLYGQKLKNDRNASRAADYFQRALNVNPRHTGSLIEMGQYLYSKGESEAALPMLEQALELDPKIEGLQQLVDKIRREGAVEGNFKKRRGRYFTVSYEGRAVEPVARLVMGMLNDAAADIGGEMKYYPRESVHVVIYTKDQYRSATLSPHWAGALYDGKIRVPVTSENMESSSGQAAMREMLYHEYTHALIREMTRQDIPAWLNEGLASFYELERDKRWERYKKDAEFLSGWMKSNPLPPMSSLPNSFTEINDTHRAEYAYQLSRTFVAWLIDAYKPYRVQQVLEGTAKGLGLGESIQRTYRKSLTELESEWKTEIRQLR